MNKRRTTLRISFTALFAALTAGGMFAAIPIGPVPIVLQNLFALLSGLILGPLLGGAAVALYLGAGILGFPVFAGGTGGLAHLAGPTGGYLVGYLLAALAAGLIAGRPRRGIPTPLPRIIIATAAGLLVVYLPGLYRLKTLSGMDWPMSLTVGLVPFLLGDALKGAAAVLISPRLRRLCADYLDE
ncbi:MAG: biotin transporter BioY [Treponema sp.]|nr:biotin transporter BioY [Treponema sp.]